MLAALAASWALLAAAFLAALLLLRRAPAPQPAGFGLVISGLFQDLIRYGKTKRGCGQLPGWLRLLQVPKRWFTHFYVVSVLWNGFLLICLFQAEFLGESFPSWIQDMHHALGRDSQNKDMEGGKLCIFLCFPGDIENQPLLYNCKHKKQWRKLRWRSDSCSAVELNRPIRCIISSAPKWLFIDEDCFIPKLGKWWKVL